MDILIALYVYIIVNVCDFEEHYTNGNVYTCIIDVKVSENQLNVMADKLNLDL